MMEVTSKVRGRARGRVCPFGGQTIRPGNVQRSAGASGVRPVNDCSLQSVTNRTTTAVARLNLKEQNRNQVAVVPDEDISGFYINFEANCFTGNVPLALYQYRVDFDPDVDRSQVRKKILAQVYRNTLSGYMCDGFMLFTPTPIPPDFLTKLTNLEGYSCEFKLVLRRVETEQPDYHLSHLVHKCMKLLKLQMVGRHSRDALSVGKIPNYKIQLWPGYFTTIRQQQSQIQMCCEISQKCMNKDNVFLILHQCMRQDVVNYKCNFENLIIGSIVLTDYNNRLYRIDDIDWVKTITSRYSTRNGSSISYKEYYKQRYHINVIFHYQPLLVSRAKPRELRIGMQEELYLVPELCCMTGLTDNERSKTLMLTPDERSCRLKLYHERMAKYTTERGSVFSRISILNGQLIIKTVHPWVVMCPVHIRQFVTKYVHDLQKFSGTMGMNLPRPTVQVIDDDKPATYIDGLEYAINTFNPELVLCIIINNKSDRYNAIKKICYVDRGVRSQIMLRANLNNKGIMAIATQIYCKLGGDPWIMNIPATTLMVIGIHVTRDSIDKKISYSAMVSSLDKKVTKYYTKVSTHANAEELCSNLCANIIDALKRYQRENRERLPDNIIIYRHGIRDFRWSEVRGIRTVLDILNHKKGKAIKFAFILVTKRATTLPQVEHLFNRYDFKVVSQIACHGTLSPAICNVLYDTLEFSPHYVQEITSKLTNMYYNWTGETRVPAPCQYAHKLAHIIGHSLHRIPNPRLSRTVFYL